MLKEGKDASTKKGDGPSTVALEPSDYFLLAVMSEPAFAHSPTVER